MPTMLPKDLDNNTIPAVRLKNSGAHKISALTSGSTRQTTAFDSETRIASLFAVDDVYVKFGDSTVTATNSDHFFPKGVYYDFSIGGDKVDQYTHVAVLAVTADCNVYISEKE